MKKIVMLLVSALSLLALNGCGGNNRDLTTLFVVDENGVGQSGISYQCDSMMYPDITSSNGEFSFYPGENCTFDFYDYNGTDTTNPPVDLLYIVDIADDGKNGIPYECQYFNVGTVNRTYDDGIWDGAFDYDYDDRCVFYL